LNELFTTFIEKTMDDDQMTPTEIQFAALSDEAFMKVKIFMDHLAKDSPHPEAVSKSQQAAVDAWRKMRAFTALPRSN